MKNKISWGIRYSIKKNLDEMITPMIANVVRNKLFDPVCDIFYFRFYNYVLDHLRDEINYYDMDK